MVLYFRFQEAQRWEGVRDATKPGPVFPEAAGAPFLEGRNVDRCMKVSDAYSRDFATFIKTGQPNENRKKYDENRENVWIYGNL